MVWYCMKICQQCQRHVRVRYPSKGFSGESDEQEPAARSRSSQHEHDRAPVPDATPHRSLPSHAQTRRDQASPSHPGRTHSYNNKQTTHRDAALFQRRKKITVKLYTHQRPRNRCGSSLDLSHITRTIRPSSLASGPGSAGPSGGGGGAGAGDAGMGGGTSMESPRQPAFWRFAGVGVGGGGGLGACARTLAINSAS